MTKTYPRVGIVHSPLGPASLRDILAASRETCTPVLFFDRADPGFHADQAKLASRLTEVHVVSQQELAHLPVKLDGVAFIHDRGLEASEILAERFGFPTGELRARAWDKFHQRGRLVEAGLSSITPHSVDTADHFERIAANLNYLGVLKPRRGNSSEGVYMMRSREDFEYIARAVQEWHGMVVEDAIPAGCHPASAALGDYVSVEMVSDTEHHAVAVVDKLSGYSSLQSGQHRTFIESGHVLPSALPPDLQRNAIDYVARCLTSLGVRWHVTQSEVKIGPWGMEMIEVNGRPGGNSSQLIRSATARYLVEDALRLALSMPFQVVEPLRDSGDAHFHARLLSTFDREHEIVRSHASGGGIRDLPGIIDIGLLARQGARRSESGHRAAVVTIRADSLAELISLSTRTFEAVGDLFPLDRLLRPEPLGEHG